jgi:hypothetical protein
MVRKRVKRKATAISSTTASGVLENIEKNSAQVYNQDLPNVKTVIPNQEMPCNDLDLLLKGHNQPIPDNLASVKFTMVFANTKIIDFCA